MPLRIEVKINERTLKVIHIARMTHNGTKPDAVNEYAVVVDEGKLLYGLEKTFVKHPDEWEYDVSEIRFEHRYGDDELMCLDRALEAIRTASGAYRSV